MWNIYSVEITELFMIIFLFVFSRFFPLRMRVRFFMRFVFAHLCPFPVLLCCPYHLLYPGGCGYYLSVDCSAVFVIDSLKKVLKLIYRAKKLCRIKLEAAHKNVMEMVG